MNREGAESSSNPGRARGASRRALRRRVVALTVLVASCLPRIHTDRRGALDASLDADVVPLDQSNDVPLDVPDSAVDRFETPAPDGSLDARDGADVGPEGGVDAPIDAPIDVPDAGAAALRLRAPASVCVPPGAVRSLRLELGFELADAPVTLTAEAIAAATGLSVEPLAFAAPPSASRPAFLRMSRAAGAANTAPTSVRLVARTVSGMRVEWPLDVRATACAGTLDASFNSTGAVAGALQLALPDGAYRAAEPFLLSRDARSRWLVVGAVSTMTPWYSDPRSDTGIWRVTDEGSLDRTFNPGGALPAYLQIDTGVFAEGHAETPQVAVTNGEQLSILGIYYASIDPTAPQERVAMTRVTAVGALDTTFGDDAAGGAHTGTRHIAGASADGPIDGPSGLVPMPDGGSVLFGTTRDRMRFASAFALRLDAQARPSPAGSRHVLFGGDMTVNSRAVVVDGDFAVLAGSIGAGTGEDTWIARVDLRSLTLDPTFGPGGITRVNASAQLGYGTRGDTATDLAIGAGEYIVAGETSAADGSGRAYLLRIARDGALARWPAGGATALAVSCQLEADAANSLRSLARAPDGTLFVAGTCVRPHADGHAYVAAFDGSGAPIDAFASGAVPGVFVWDFADGSSSLVMPSVGWGLRLDERGRPVLTVGRYLAAEALWQPWIVRLVAREAL